MGTLAIDIETSSPFKEPPGFDDFDQTEYFELFAVALGYHDGQQTESAVLFRDGGWEPEITADLLDRTIEWCEGRTVDRTLTYNGTGFDEVHLRNWSKDIVNQQIRSDLDNQVNRLFDTHNDLAIPAAERHRHRLGSKDFPKFENVCQWEGIEPTRTYYADYESVERLVEQTEISSDQVQGWHVGTVWGERYVDWIEAGADDTKAFNEVQQLVEDYAVADVEPLFALDAALASGGGG